MLICEIFYSLQGEGTYIGTPSIFIRTSICNLRCQFCDSSFSSWWNEGKHMTVEEIYQEVQKYGFIKHIVITGGEPMIQKELVDLVDTLKRNNYYITIETNGTIFREDVKPHLYSISPKTSNSIPTKKLDSDKIVGSIEFLKKLHIKNMKYDKLPDFLTCGCELQFKFVIQSRIDLKEIETIVETCKIPNDLVFLMPEGITRESQEERSLEVAEICKNKQWNFCPRLQINLWGSKRGV